jgi:hypothetical protein
LKPLTRRFEYRINGAMIRIPDLLSVADAFRAASGVERETTLSHRIFGDGKVLGRLRAGGEITVGRFNAAMLWFAESWPADVAQPEVLAPYAAEVERMRAAA